MGAVIAKDTTVVIRHGGVFDGTPTWASAITLTCYARSYKREITQNVVDGGAICDAYEQSIPTRKTGTVTMDLIVDPTTGPVFQDKHGHYLEVAFDSGATTYTDQGLVTSIGLSTDIDGLVTETVTMKLGVQGIV
jgi:hypothetical protein